jgi:hypothetical protein
MVAGMAAIGAGAGMIAAWKANCHKQWCEVNRELMWIYGFLFSILFPPLMGGIESLQESKSEILRTLAMMLESCLLFGKFSRLILGILGAVSGTILLVGALVPCEQEDDFPNP